MICGVIINFYSYAGIGSNVAMMSCIMTVVRDRFKKVKAWQAALVIAIFGTVSGSVYMTPVSNSLHCLS